MLHSPRLWVTQLVKLQSLDECSNALLETPLVNSQSIDLQLQGQVIAFAESSCIAASLHIITSRSAHAKIWQCSWRSAKAMISVTYRPSTISDQLQPRCSCCTSMTYLPSRHTLESGTGHCLVTNAMELKAMRQDSNACCSERVHEFA